MKEYHKIEGLWIRDMEGTKQLQVGQFRNPIVEYLQNNEWIFTEKVDGMNIRVLWNGHTFLFAGRTDRSHLPGLLFEHLKETFLNKAMEEMFEQMFGEKEVMIIGEGYGGKIQSGSNYNKEQKFIVFDIMIGDWFLARENVEEICHSLNLECVPVILVGTIQQGVEFIKHSRQSEIAHDVKEMEGLVGTPMIPLRERNGARIIVKIKTFDYKC